MKEYYYIGGTYSPEGMGSNYFGNMIVLKVLAESRNESDDIVNDFFTKKYGPREYKDLWYGEMAWNWKAEPHTEYAVKKIYKNRWDTIRYHTNNASILFKGTELTEEQIDKKYNEYLAEHPIYVITNGVAEKFENDIKNL